MSKNVILSIKPKYVEEIINGNKIYEYRKLIFKREVNKIYIYSSYPEKRIIGFFKYNGYLEGSPKNIWNLTCGFSGISKYEYDKYYKDKEIAYALRIINFIKFDKVINPKELISDFRAPQSYMYTEIDFEKNIK
ncbi:hypothetical protein P5F16_01125 [Clostridium perfringens]|nr:hypothetical protein [Clostridium perfringens]